MRITRGSGAPVHENDSRERASDNPYRRELPNRSSVAAEIYLRLVCNRLPDADRHKKIGALTDAYLAGLRGGLLLRASFAPHFLERVEQRVESRGASPLRRASSSVSGMLFSISVTSSTPFQSRDTSSGRLAATAMCAFCVQFHEKLKNAEWMNSGNVAFHRG